MELSIFTPGRKLIERVEVGELFAPAYMGQLNILPGHANLLSELQTGILKWKESTGTWKECSVSTGFLEVMNGNVTILSEVSEFPTEVNKDRAKKAETTAREKLEQGGLDDENFKKYELKLRRAMTRQSLGE